MLWASIQEILALPDETRLFTGHDYQPGGRNPQWESTVGEQKRLNPHLAGMDEARFVALREARDRTLPMPKLILHALQVNVRGRAPAGAGGEWPTLSEIPARRAGGRGMVMPGQTRPSASDRT